MLALDVCAQDAADQVPANQAAADQAAYDQAAPNQAPAPALSAEQLDQLLAPIALYPDALLAQVLMASTYPLEIVEADRWLQNPGNSALSGEALNTALQQQPWDPSVKSLVPFPQILKMMDDHLNWTEQLGDAFLANRTAVMDSVQRLRQQAQAAGNLKSTHYQTVAPQGSVIVIESPAPDILYVPVYDPFLVYGPWPYPAYPPYYFPGYFDVVVMGGAAFGWFGFGIDVPLWGWGFWDWPRHRVFVDRRRFNEINFRHRPIDNDTWRHDPEHRHGVPYRYENTRQRFGPGGTALGARPNFRGYPNEPRHEQRREQGPGHDQGPGREQHPGREQNPNPGQNIVQPLPQVVHPLPQVVHPLPQLVTPPVVARPPQGERHDMQQRAAQPPPFVQPQAVQPRSENVRPGRSFERQGAAPPQQFRAPQPYRAANPPPAFESFGRGSEVRSQSQRGYSSRHSEPGGGARTQQSAPQGGGFRRRDH